ncbi:hypothetical protein EUA66_02915, partial [TM7 phylum sp. oral taxon 349]
MSKKSKNSQSILRLFWRASQSYKWRRNIAVIATATTFIVGMFVGPLIIAQLLDIIQHRQLSNTSNLWQLVILYGLSQLWSEIIGWRLVLYLVWTF